jgi:hypothetical protein
MSLVDVAAVDRPPDQMTIRHLRTGQAEPLHQLVLAQRVTGRNRGSPRRA